MDDNNAMEAWKEKECKPNIANSVNSASRLDRMESHIPLNFVDSAHLIGARVTDVPAAYNSSFEPCYFRILKSFKA